MLKLIRDILDSPMAAITVVGLLIAGIVFLVRLEGDVLQLQNDVVRLEHKIDSKYVELEQKIDSNHEELLKAINEVLTALANHSHDSDGRVQIALVGNE